MPNLPFLILFVDGHFNYCYTKKYASLTLYFPGGYCPGGTVEGGYCPGILSGGMLSGGYCLGGYCLGGYCLGGYCPTRTMHINDVHFLSDEKCSSQGYDHMKLRHIYLV